MELAKLTILSIVGVFQVSFNPNSYSITKAVKWTPVTAKGKASTSQRKVNAPALSFGGGESRKLTLELFFDVTEPIDGIFYPDVRILTDQMVALTRIVRGGKHPPVCIVLWGMVPNYYTFSLKSDFPFRGVVSSLTRDGWP